MPNFDLKYFMREELKTDEIVEVPGLATFKDDKGAPIPFQIKVIGIERINELRKAYSKNRIVIDEKGKRLFDKAGKPVLERDVDSVMATNRLIVEALVFPDLKNQELMEFYGCHDIDQMPFKVFKKNTDYQYVSEKVTEVLGLSSQEDEPSDDELVAEAKN
ncbi:phage tail assembly chaperone [Anaerovorax sp. IOR16]|uniref:phage tail assembly chaperone n=1 Tax=Anaerovorax sp. IOR16 TaxID=2773458 RepID=UPI0019D03383|nr:hypothetical protein [Anaerovorax sp. IOR16]